MNNTGQTTTASIVQPAKPTGKKNTVLIVIIGVVVIIVGLIVGHRIFNNTNASPTPEPTDTGVSTDAVATPSPVPVDKSNVSILIENGTGISGEAAYLEGILKNDN